MHIYKWQLPLDPRIVYSQHIIHQPLMFTAPLQLLTPNCLSSSQSQSLWTPLYLSKLTAPLIPDSHPFYSTHFLVHPEVLKEIAGTNMPTHYSVLMFLSLLLLAPWTQGPSDHSSCCTQTSTCACAHPIESSLRKVDRKAVYLE